MAGDRLGDRFHDQAGECPLQGRAVDAGAGHFDQGGCRGDHTEVVGAGQGEPGVTVWRAGGRGDHLKAGVTSGCERLADLLVALCSLGEPSPSGEKITLASSPRLVAASGPSRGSTRASKGRA